MKVYVDIDDTRKITTYHNGLNIKQGLYVYSKDKIVVESLSDYTKQVRKEVCKKITEELLDISHEYWKTFLKNGVQYMTSNDLYALLKEISNQIQGE